MPANADADLTTTPGANVNRPPLSTLSPVQLEPPLLRTKGRSDCQTVDLKIVEQDCTATRPPPSVTVVPLIVDAAPTPSTATSSRTRVKVRRLRLATAGLTTVTAVPMSLNEVSEIVGLKGKAQDDCPSDTPVAKASAPTKRLLAMLTVPAQPATAGERYASSASVTSVDPADPETTSSATTP